MRDKSQFRLPGYICPPLDAAIWRPSWWDLWCRSGQTISNLKTILMQQFEDHIAAEADRSAISRPSWCSILKSWCSNLMIMLMQHFEDHLDADISAQHWWSCRCSNMKSILMQQFENHLDAAIFDAEADRSTMCRAYWCSNLKTILMQHSDDHVDAAIWRPSWCRSR